MQDFITHIDLSLTAHGARGGTRRSQSGVGAPAGGAGDHARARAGGRDAGRDSRPSAFESNAAWGIPAWGPRADAAFAGPAAHPMLLRPRISDEGEPARAPDAAAADAAATGDGAGGPSAPRSAGGADRPRGGPQTASLQSVLASISGEMSRLAVAPGAGDFRGAGAPRGAPRARTDSGFVVLPEVESLGSLLRIERASDRHGDGRARQRAGFPGEMGRRGLSVSDARVATWRDVAALGPNEESPAHFAPLAAVTLEEVLETVLSKPPSAASGAGPAAKAKNKAAVGEKTAELASELRDAEMAPRDGADAEAAATPDCEHAADLKGETVADTATPHNKSAAALIADGVLGLLRELGDDLGLLDGGLGDGRDLGDDGGLGDGRADQAPVAEGEADQRAEQLPDDLLVLALLEHGGQGLPGEEGHRSVRLVDHVVAPVVLPLYHGGRRRS